MKFFCTVCDSNYLHKGLAMYRSLVKNVEGPITLYWLCLDSQTFEKLTALNLPGIELYDVVILESRSIELQQARRNPPSQYGTAYSQFCWTCTPFFINLLLHTKGFDVLFYIDADIYLYGDPQVIIDVMGKKSVAIHTHRFTGRIEDQPKLPDGIGTTNISGWYNVGVLAFRNNQIARMVAQQWKNWMVQTTHKYYADYGTCGDQKYWELLMSMYGDNICVFDIEGRICHQAPWCTDSCGDIPVLFYHFSHFNFDLAAGTWRDHQQDPAEWSPASQPGIRTLYENYYEQIYIAGKLLSDLQ